MKAGKTTNAQTKKKREGPRRQGAKGHELRWNLDDILPMDRFEALFAEVERDRKRYDAWYKKLSPTMSAKEFREFIAFDEALDRKLALLTDMPSLHETTDQKDSSAKRLKGRATDLAVRVEDAGRKCWHWIKGMKTGKDKPALDDKNAKRLFGAIPDLAYVLARTREAAKHTLAEGEEAIVNKLDSIGSSVLVNLREVMEAECTFTFHPKNAKEARTITNESEMIKYVRSADAFEREAAYRGLFANRKEHLLKYFMIYEAIVKNWTYQAALRGYPSPIAMRNFANHVPDKAIETLLAVCAKRAPVFHRYFRWKARQLGTKTLRRFDVYAPLATTEKNVSFTEAQRIVFEQFERFSPAFAGRARKILDERHVDSHPRRNKQGGAFCATVAPDIAPYVLLNYTNTDNDVMTLAHELGHGVHSLYADKLPISAQHAPLPLAETASTFGEMLVFEALLASADQKEKRALLSEKLAASFATILRQSYFVEFELRAHEAIPRGMTAEQLSDLYFTMLEKQFGSSVDLDKGFRYEWALIPHIVHTPFYCYAYNFGDLLSLALYAEYKKEKQAGRDFVPKIEALLAAGGSCEPQRLLRETAGFDMTDPTFWERGFAIIEGWQKELEGL